MSVCCQSHERLLFQGPGMDLYHLFPFVNIVLQRDLRLRLGGNDGIHSRTHRRRSKVIAAQEKASAFGGLFNAPQENMVTHGLGPYLGTARKRFAQHGKTAAGIQAYIARKLGFNRQFVAVLKRRHAVCIESAITADEIYCRRGIFTGTLVRYAGIVNVFKIAILDENIIAAMPYFKCVSKAYL